MATRAAIYIPIGPDAWAQVYNHYDGSPDYMLPALNAHQPDAILTAKEIREITPEAIDAFTDARSPETMHRPTFPEWASHAYVLTSTGWKHADSPAKLATICR